MIVALLWMLVSPALVLNMTSIRGTFDRAGVSPTAIAGWVAFFISSGAIELLFGGLRLSCSSESWACLPVLRCFGAVWVGVVLLEHSYMRALVTFGPAYRRPIGFAVAQQVLVVVLAAFLLDGGAMLRASLFAVASHWAIILPVMFRRPSSPTAFDLGLIRFGFIPVAVAAGVIAGLLGRTI